MYKIQSMDLKKFFENYSTLESCESHFKLQRENEGVICKKCNGDKQYWLSNKSQWQCASCEFRTTLRSGTIMENSKFDIQVWYTAMYLICLTKKGMSCVELQKKLGLPRYQSTLFLYHRIRKAMGKRDDCYILNGTIELDEGYFKVETSAIEKNKTKAGRGSTEVQPVAVMTESTPLENESGTISNHCGYYKLKVLENHEADEINKIVEKNLSKDVIIFSDESTSYTDLADLVEGHISEKSSEETTKKLLKWVHIAIGNARRVFNGIYHKISKKYLQLYLDEFCYKLNRRRFGNKLFDRLALACAATTGKVT